MTRSPRSSLLPARAGLLAGALASLLAPGAIAGAERAAALISRAALDPGDAVAAPARPMALDATDDARDLSGMFGAVTRGAAIASSDGSLGTLDWDMENLPLLPAPMTGFYPVTWGGAWSGFTGWIALAAPTSPLAPPQFGAVNEPIGGNATVKMRALASPAFGPNTFFGRWARLDFRKTPASSPRLLVRPDSTQNLRVTQEVYVTAITSLWASEPTNVSSGFVVSRLLWGGQNSTTGIGLPVGPIPHFYTLSPDPTGFLQGIFSPCLFPAGHPQAGANVPAPIGQWFRLIHETTATGNLIHKIDLLDGQGEIEIYDFMSIQVGRVDRMAYSGAFETEGDAMYVDNLHVEGVEFVLPTPPPLACSMGIFGDNFEWMFPGPVAGQSTVVFDALSARAYVKEDAWTSGNQAVCRTVFFNDDLYRRENGRTLPFTVALAQPGGNWRLCMDLELTPAPGDPYETVQVVAPVSLTDNSFVTRLLIGRYDPNGSPQFSHNLFVQVNPDYNPIDDENSPNPHLPGSNGNGGVPVIGTDIVDTGVAWPFGGPHTVCFEVANNRAMTISLDGVPIHTGTAFVNSLDRLDFESENNSAGVGDEFCFDNISLTCTDLPVCSGCPGLALPYLDNLEWGLEGVSIGLQGVGTSNFAWTSGPDMPTVAVTIDGRTSKVLEMENHFRDFPAAAPNTAGFLSFTQASTRMPSVTASASRGWVAGALMLLTDGATSRTWSAASATTAPTQFARVAGLTYSSVTQTFWFQKMAPTVPNPFATTWVDTGATLASVGAGLNQWFEVTVVRSLSGTLHFRIDGAPLRYVGGVNNGQIAFVQPLESSANGVHKNLDRFFYLGSDEDSAPVGSILYTDNIVAWSLPCPGDANRDGYINFADLNTVLAQFGQSASPTGYLAGNVAPDANNDGVADDTIVNFADLNTVLGAFGMSCSAQQ